MKEAQVKQVIKNKAFPDKKIKPRLVETHISWVILTSRYAFKIKKPLKYSFLDFSTVEQRKYYCERELELNSRLTKNMYLKVLPVTMEGDHVKIGNGNGEILDYAVMMKKLRADKQMDVLLKKNRVDHDHIEALARVLLGFHKKAQMINKKFDAKKIKESFNDIDSVKDYANKHIGNHTGETIDLSIQTSNKFLQKNKNLFVKRIEEGFVRDCHGDLHSKNIFLYAKPVIFDCIEFNDDFRQIDLLDEIAFFCMDLEDHNREDLSHSFQQFYFSKFPCMRNEQEGKLFVYYKLYRANVRAKVSLLKAKQAHNATEEKSRLNNAAGYLKLMNKYCRQFR